MEPLRRNSDLYSLEWNFGSIGISDGNDIDRKMGTHSDEEIILASSRPKKRAGRKKFKETRHPVYRGVRRKNTNKWVCEVREPSKHSRIWLGTYPTADMAARAHDVAALAFKGQTTTLNFADSVWRLPVPVSKDPKHIRKAAMEAAEKFRPRSGIEISPICIEDLKREKVGDGRSSNNEERESVFYMDEEEEEEEEEEVVSDKKDWEVNMAEGPLFSPSTARSGCGFSWDDIDSDVEVSLWSNWSY